MDFKLIDKYLIFNKCFSLLSNVENQMFVSQSLLQRQANFDEILHTDSINIEDSYRSHLEAILIFSIYFSKTQKG